MEEGGAEKLVAVGRSIRWRPALVGWVLTAVLAVVVLVVLVDTVVRGSGHRKRLCDTLEDLPALGLGDDAECATSYLRDLDGDGADDRIIAYYRHRAPDAFELRLRLAPGRGTPSEVRLHEVVRPYEPEFDSITDINFDGRPEILVVKHFDANTHNVAAFVVENGHLAPVVERGRNGKDTPLEFPVGTAFAHGSDYSCEDVNGDSKPELVLASYSGDWESERWQWQRKEYRWVSPRAVELVRSRSGVVEVDWQYTSKRFVGDGACDTGRVTPSALPLRDPATSPLEAVNGLLHEWRTGNRDGAAAFIGSGEYVQMDLVAHLFDSGLDPAGAVVDRCEPFAPPGHPGSTFAPPSHAVLCGIVIGGSAGGASADVRPIRIEIHKTPTGPWYGVVDIRLPDDLDFEGGL